MTTIQLQNISCKTNTPIFIYCRRLAADGINLRTKRHVYRGDVLAVTVKTIGKGAKLTVKEDKYGTPVFRKYVSHKDTTEVCREARTSV